MIPMHLLSDDDQSDRSEERQILMAELEKQIKNEHGETILQLMSQSESESGSSSSVSGALSSASSLSSFVYESEGSSYNSDISIS